MNENDMLFDELVLKIENTCFAGGLPKIGLPSLVAIVLTAVLTAIPCVAQAESHLKEWFAEKLCVALARRLSTAERKEWLN